MDLQQRITAAVRGEIERRSWTQREAAAHLGHTEQWMSGRLTGFRPWNLDDLEQLTRTLPTVDWPAVIRGTGTRAPETVNGQDVTLLDAPMPAGPGGAWIDSALAAVAAVREGRPRDRAAR